MPSVQIITTQQKRIFPGGFSYQRIVGTPGSHIRTAPARRPVNHHSRPPLCSRSPPVRSSPQPGRPQTIRHTPGPAAPTTTCPLAKIRCSREWRVDPAPGPRTPPASSSPTRFSHHRTNPLGPTDRARQQGGERGKEEQPRLTRRPGPHVTGPANRERRASETSPPFPRPSSFPSSVHERASERK